jgi:chaperone BCS1
MNRGDNMNGFVHVQLVSMINAIKTGDPTVDIPLAMILPYLIGQLFSKDIVLWIKNLVFRSRKEEAVKPMQERTISYRTQRTEGGALVEMDRDNYNMVLIKAVQLYVDKNCQLELDQAEVDLTTIETNTGLGNNTNSAPRRARGNRSNGSTATLSALLKTCDLVERPLPRRFHNLGIFGGQHVWMKLDDSIAGDGGKSGSEPDGGNFSDNKKGVRNIQITLRSSSKASIHSFIKTVYQWYNDQLVAIENNDRYYFDLKSNESRRTSPSFQRYVLGDEKTFETLFSHQCHKLQKIVDQFEAKTGRYSIQGYPYKLGLLLSGIPGTGKTSLIKALSHYLKRHIVNIPLSCISTNSELMGLLFNKHYSLDDTGALTELDLKHFIFVLEDVDAGSSVVKSRDLIQAEEEEGRCQTHVTEATAAKATSPSSSAPRAVVSSFSSDPLNLTGLLNALDGLVETPGRIVIMTTNHPEMLDKALTRPGRIDRQLVMGYMISEEMGAMINHYYETNITNEQEAQLQQLVIQQKLEITAAELECLTAEFDTVDELLNTLWKRVKNKEKKEERGVALSCCSTDTSTISSYSSDENDGGFLSTGGP